MYLLDVNVLIALCDPYHVHHQRVRMWFRSAGHSGWATCPLTENGLVRILGQSTYPGFSGSPDDALALLKALVTAPGHEFWPDHLSLREDAIFSHLPPSKHLTDIYLLALAVTRQSRLATLDQRIDPSIIPGGPLAYFVIP